MHPSSPKSSLHCQTRRSRKLNRLFAGAVLSLLTMGATAQAGNLTRSGISAAPGTPATSTSQTSTTATTTTSQAAQTAAMAQQAQISMQRSVQVLQAQMNAQNAARSTALSASSTVANGLSIGGAGVLPGLVPQGGLTAPISPAIDNVQLTTTGSSLTVANGGSVILPAGTSGNDQISLSGSGGSIVAAGGTVTVKTGAVTTTTGGSLATSGAGSITTTASGGTVTTSSGVTVTSTEAGSYTAPGGTATSFAANSPITVAPGSTITLSGAGTLTTNGASTLTLSGAGTLSGGTVTTGAGTTSFTGAVVASLSAGSTVNLIGNETLSLSNGASGALSLVLPAATNFSTLGSVVSYPTTSFQVPTSWSGVGSLSQSTAPVPTGSTSDYTVTIQQNSQQALLYWQSFNIGKNTTLDFDQSLGGANVGQWVAINKIASNIAPSQILGAIEAPGQVYVINQNGIIFGGSSQVNTGALVASSLPINDNLVSRGLLNNPDLQFLFSQINIPAGSLGPTPAFTPAPAPTSGNVVTQDANGNEQVGAATGVDGDVVVLAGAQLSSPTTPEHVGGKVALVGSNVSNAGTISTPDGQTILAAGQQVGFESHPSASSDPSNPAYGTSGPNLRGLDTYVGAVGQGGTVANTGTIDSERADITLVGKTVDQFGVIASTTSVSLNGRIDLLADYGAVPIFPASTTLSPNLYPTLSGTVNLGAGSLTEILPELSSTETVVGSALALQSQVNIQGNTIDLASGSTLWAPSAAVTLSTGSWLKSNPGYLFLNSTGQITLETGAIIDVSGSEDVSASVTENIVTGQLLGTELANSPLQQDGPLRGQTVEIDTHDLVNYNGETYVGTALGDLSGYVNLIQHSVGELTTNGGTVSLSAGGSVNLQSGSAINVSGGWINYQGAQVQTTQLLTSTGQIVDISQAMPDVVYSGIYNGTTEASGKWNTSQTFTNSLQNGSYYEPGYIQGGNGGSISITAPAITVSGNLYGRTVAGSLQRSAITTTTNAGVESWMAQPISSSLSLTFQATKDASLLTYSPAPPDIVFQPDGGSKATDPFAESGNPEVDLSSDLVDVDGFGNLTIINNNAHYESGNSGAVTGAGNIVVPAGVSLVTQPGGSISFSAANIDIEGEVASPGGSLSFTAQNTSPLQLAGLTSTPAPDPTRGQFTLGSQAVLDASGLLVDNRSSSSTANTLPLVINGGGITISGYNVDLAQGSKINVSGGASISSSLSIKYGVGGSLTINAGEDPTVNAVQGGQLVLDSELDGYSGGQGASLSILAPLIQIGGSTLLNGDTTATGRTLWINQTDSQGNLLSPDFFDQGGFSSFALNGIGALITGQSNPSPGLLIAADAKIAPEAESLLLTTNANGGLSLNTTILPQADRAPVSLSFSATGVTDQYPTPTLIVRGDLVMEAGASIQLDPNAQGKVSFKGSTVALLGQVIAPGGTINVSGGTSTAKIFFDTSDVLATVDLGPNSVLSTAGATLLTPNDLGYHTGTVLNGGSIAISGNIVAEKGALLDVSGASAVLDVTSTSTSTLLGSARTQSPVVSTQVDSNGGTITLTGSQELYVDATLKGYAGGITAQGGTSSADGGSLIISSGVFLSPNVSLSSLSALDQAIDQTGLIVVTQDASNYPLTGLAVIGSNVPASAPLPDTTSFLGYGHFGASSFNQSGLDSLTLNGSVLFSGTTTNPVTLKANGSLKIATGGIILADDQGTNLGVPINLSASYVDLGTPFLGPMTSNELGPVFEAGQQLLYFSPTWGLSTLNVTAGELVDVGDLSLQKIGKLNLTVGTNTIAGDIRGDGTLDVAGQITLTAGQVYPTTEADFDIVAYNYTDVKGAELSSITINSIGAVSQTPLSAGGQLNIYASTITQNGVLRAPIGSINLGWDGTGSSPIDYLSGAGSGAASTPATVNATQQLTLGAGSLTSVSAVDSTLGPLTIPYGNLANGVSWIDPSGADITASGVPGKTITISALNVSDQVKSTIDISGGGDLYAYNWVTGTGGTNDILNSTTSFAIIPGYNTAYAPYYSSNTSSDFVNTKLAVGEQVYLNASSGLPAGTYTLLPAGYALLPGAYLVTPQSGAATNVSSVKPDGSSIVSGYTFNGLDSTPTSQPLLTSFEVASQSVVRSRAEYDNYSANSWLAQSAISNNASVPRLPVDSGQVVLEATQTMNINGSLASLSGAGGLGGLVDIASPSEIDLVSGTVTPTPGILTLDSATLQNFAAASLLIGGYRTVTGDGTDVTVTTSSLNVETGAVLTGSDIILVSNGALTIAGGADIELSSSAVGTAPALVLGNANNVGSGDGVLVRVSNDPSAQISRLGVDTQNNQDALADPPSLSIGANAQIGGFANSDGTVTAAGSVTLDSTNRTSLDPKVSLGGNATALNSGQISLQLNNPGSLALGSNGKVTFGLVLSNTTLQNLQATAQSLSLLSYSSIDIYGDGTIGGAAVSGQYPVASLALHAAEIRGFSASGGGGTVTINAQNVSLDNSPNGAGPGAIASSSGSFTINAATIDLGTNQLNIDQYSNVIMNASSGIMLNAETKVTQADTSVVNGTGGVTASNNLTLNTPLITASSFSSTQAPGNETISATGGALNVTNTFGTSSSSVTEGLGASLTLVGASVSNGSDIVLRSGNLTLEATAGDVTLAAGGTLDVSGTAKAFNNLLQYTNAGQVTLTSNTGNVTLDAGSTVNVSAQSAAGNAGTLTVTTSSSASGIFTLNGVVEGEGGAGGQNGSFSLDVGSLPKLSSIDPALETGGFTLSRSIRVRTGDVAVDDTATAQTFNLSTDQGSIVVTGTGIIDASGATGGTIDLAAVGSVTLQAGSALTVQGQNFNNAGKGGSVTLEAGDYTAATANLWQTSAGSGGTEIYTGSATVTIALGSSINLSVASVNGITDPTAQAAALAAATAAGDVTGTLHIRAPQIAGSNGIAITSLAGSIKNASNVVIEGFSVQDAKTSGTASIDSFEGNAEANATAFMNNATTIQINLVAGNSSFAAVANIEPGEEIDNSSGSLVLNNDWDLSTLRYGASEPLTITPSGSYADSIYYNGGVQMYAKVEPGILTMRAAGNIVFNGSLSDGFGDSAGDIPVDASTGDSAPWENTLLPNFQNNLVTVASSNTSSAAVTLASATLPTGFAVGSQLLGSTVLSISGATVTLAAAPNAAVSNAAEAYSSAGGSNLVAVASSSTDSTTVTLASATLPSGFTIGSQLLGSTVLSISGNTVTLANNANAAVSNTNTAEAFSTIGAGQQSWSYRLTAGADMTAANFQAVQPLSSLAANSGSIEVGLFALTPSGQTVSTSSTVNAIINPRTGISLYQVIRTGTGDITVSAGRDVQLDNQFATIYTAGTQASSIQNFDTPTPLDVNFNSLYPAQYSQNGGNVTITAQNNIEHLTEDSNGDILPDSERELPNNWLYRRGYVDGNGNFGQAINGDIASTSWWVDFSNFFEGVGALGGGNVTMTAGHDVVNVDAVVPTNARMTNQTTLANGNVSTLASDQTLVELGGGNLLVQAGNDINAGVYYVEHGQGVLDAGNQILTNATRAPSLSSLGIAGAATESSYAWLPTTLFLGGQQTDGQGSSFTVSAGGDLLLGPTANPFLLPSGMGNSYWYKTYFSTYASNDSVNVSSLTGSVTLREDATLTTTAVAAPAPLPILATWFSDVLLVAPGSTTTAAYYQPWLALDETSLTGVSPNEFDTVTTVLPPTLNVTSFSGDINVVGTLNLSPAADGTINLLASGSLNAFQPDGTTINQKTKQLQVVWASGEINLSDADPASIPGVNNPYAYQSQADVGTNTVLLSTSRLLDLSGINNLFAVSGSITGTYGVLQTKEELHAQGLLHLNDPTPIYLYAETGDISGLNLFSGKAAQLVAGQDITDIALYIQNDNSSDISLIESGRDIIAYDLTSVLRQQVNLSTSVYSGYNPQTAPLGAGSGLPNAGDIQIAGPGTLEVLAGRNLNLGVGANNLDGTGVGITSIGSSANPYLPFAGADIIAGAGIGAPGFDNSQMNFAAFNALFLEPGSSESAIYLPDLLQFALPTASANQNILTPYLQNLSVLMGLPSGATSSQVVSDFQQLPASQQTSLAWKAFSQLPAETQNVLSLDIFYLVLRDAGRDHNNGASPYAGTYTQGYAAIDALFSLTSATTWPSTGDISLTSREIKTTNGGNISLLAPGGQLNVGLNLSGNQPADQGILTTDGGGINIFANGNINVGTSRIFTLHGGNEIIWSTNGDIDAGSSSKTVLSAPPTRVLIDPQSADVETDLAGLATGGGIGVLDTIVGVAPGDVDLIAPKGTVNAGDAGIRASGNLNIAAVQVLNAGNISVGGKSSGVPATASSNVAGMSAASNTAGAASNTATDAARQAASGATAQQSVDLPSIITVEVLGYGGGDDDAGA